MTNVVFFDTDCICSFLWTESEYLLTHCFGSNMIIPRQVYNEIARVPHLLKRIDTLIDDKFLTIGDILINGEDNTLYLALTNYNQTSVLPLIGKGEAAAIVLTKRNNGILASNNFRDVKYYVELYGLDHISTPDIIHRAVKNQLLTIKEADAIWIQMIVKKRKLPHNTFSEYLDDRKANNKVPI